MGKDVAKQAGLTRNAWVGRTRSTGWWDAYLVRSERIARDKSERDYAWSLFTDLDFGRGFDSRRLHQAINLILLNNL